MNISPFTVLHYPCRKMNIITRVKFTPVEEMAVPLLGETSWAFKVSLVSNTGRAVYFALKFDLALPSNLQKMVEKAAGRYIND